MTSGTFRHLCDFEVFYHPLCRLPALLCKITASDGAAPNILTLLNGYTGILVFFLIFSINSGIFIHDYGTVFVDFGEKR